MGLTKKTKALMGIKARIDYEEFYNVANSFFEIAQNSRKSLGQEGNLVENIIKDSSDIIDTSSLEKTLKEYDLALENLWKCQQNIYNELTKAGNDLESQQS